MEHLNFVRVVLKRRSSNIRRVSPKDSKLNSMHLTPYTNCSNVWKYIIALIDEKIDEKLKKIWWKIIRLLEENKGEKSWWFQIRPRVVRCDTNAWTIKEKKKLDFSQHLRNPLLWECNRQRFKIYATDLEKIFTNHRCIYIWTCLLYLHM